MNKYSKQILNKRNKNAPEQTNRISATFDIYNFGIARSVRLSVLLPSCLGYRNAGCLQLSHHRPPEMCGLRTRPRTDVDPPPVSIIVSLPPGR